MKTDKTAINLLFFSYAFFSFAIMIPKDKMTVYDWIKQLVLYGLIYIIIILFTADNKKFKPLTNLILLIYIISLISRQALKMWNYMKLYHGQTTANSTVLVTIFTVILLSYIKDSRLSQLYFPLSISVAVLLFIVFILNVDKISSYNLYNQYQNNGLALNVTLFDYIVPYVIAVKTTGANAKKDAIYTLFFTTMTFIAITLFAFMSVKGNILYSLSPLQMLFQVSSTKLIRNFDALFNYIVYFSYFGALSSLITSYGLLKENFTFFNKGDLLLAVPFFILFSKIENLYYLLIW